jgi:hypothetical protein
MSTKPASYNLRMQPVWAKLKHHVHTSKEEWNKVLQFNNELLLNARSGRYIIKFVDQGYASYISYAWKNDGWLSTTDKRSKAQWFTKKEADEFKARYKNLIQIVRR